MYTKDNNSGDFTLLLPQYVQSVNAVMNNIKAGGVNSAKRWTAIKYVLFSP